MRAGQAPLAPPPAPPPADDNGIRLFVWVKLCSAFNWLCDGVKMLPRPEFSRPRRSSSPGSRPLFLSFPCLPACLLSFGAFWFWFCGFFILSVELLSWPSHKIDFKRWVTVKATTVSRQTEQPFYGQMRVDIEVALGIRRLGGFQ